ncbi:hypothetical protein GALL_383690 [mine drainage metagenome]|uniref:Uncharacterized protein n=1 Tax=mine drainage metagenome TaxID=410659 RepID=A0A1J5QIW3_9ZZZZ
MRLLAGAQKVVVIHGHIFDAGIAQRRNHGGFPHPFGQPGSPWVLPQLLVEVGGQLVDLPHPVPGRYRRQHRLGITGTEQFGLAAPDHFLQQLHVLRIMLEHVIEQPAADVDGKAEIRIAVHRLQKRAVAAEVGVIEHMGEVADRLVGMNAEEECNGFRHDGYPCFLFDFR